MKKIRIAVVSSPGMLDEIVRNTLRRQQDLEVLPASPLPLLELVGSTAVDVVIVGSAGPRAVPDHRELLYRFPRLRVLAVQDDGRETTLYELHPRETRLGALSPGGLVDAIRGAVRT